MPATHGVDELKAREVRSLSFVKFVDESSSLLIVAVVMWAPSCATPGRGVESGGGRTSWQWFVQDRCWLRGTSPLFRKRFEGLHAYNRIPMCHWGRYSR